MPINTAVVVAAADGILLDKNARLASKDGIEVKLNINGPSHCSKEWVMLSKKPIVRPK